MTDMPTSDVKQVSSTKLYQTSDYSIFKVLHGNRAVDKQHVARLVKSLEKNGNLTQSMPILVNENMEVIDGQHRLKALEELEWPVYYEQKEALTVETVRTLNTNKKNWTLRDYCESYANMGNETYRRILNVADHFPDFNFSTVAGYMVLNHKPYKTIREGDAKIADQEQAFRLLKMLSECCDVLDRRDIRLATAFRRILLSPNYDHKRMLSKLDRYGITLGVLAKVVDYQRALEELYNKNQPEETRVRLF